MRKIFKKKSKSMRQTFVKTNCEKCKKNICLPLPFLRKKRGKYKVGDTLPKIRADFVAFIVNGCETCYSSFLVHVKGRKIEKVEIANGKLKTEPDFYVLIKRDIDQEKIAKKN